MRIFALQGTHKLGMAVVEAMGATLDPHEERMFEDGEHKARPLVTVRSDDVYVIHSLAGDTRQSANDKLMQLLFFLAACRENGAERVTAVVPYLAYARKDRQTKQRDPVTTRYVAQLFEAMGTDTVVAFDVHNLAAFQNAFRCHTVHIEPMGLFAADIVERTKGSEIAVVAPDAGAVKRAQMLKEALEKATGTPASLGFMEKHRSAGVVSGDLFTGDVANKDVIIADDMISSGGTILRAALACKDRGARTVHAYATHGVFSPQINALLENDAVASVTVTDSVDRTVANGAKIRTLSCASLLARKIRHLNSAANPI
ncbi:ribose-phosphate diphosphokinase [Pelagibacterium halotolerans]|uniref:ribose-phosphate diphosphokinase n=1 Tax=Pelagibacterium halotolerans TaxID=531813 RepID=UPI00384BCE51